MIPVLYAIIETSGTLGAEEIYIGMAHRGRLKCFDKHFREIVCGSVF